MKGIIFVFIVLSFSCSKKQYSHYNYTKEKSVILPDIAVRIPVDTLYQINSDTSIVGSVDLEMHYISAFNELEAMLEGRQPLSFKRAVFVTENAYLENQFNYQVFCNYIAALSIIAKEWSSENKLADYNFPDSTNVLLNGAIFKTLTDTVFDSNNDMVNVPYVYDFEDCFAKEKWTSMFVSKLLATHKGNCHSLPFLYKIIAEELGVKVWLSFTPNHIYLRNYCKKSGWYNTELTNAMFPTEAWIMASGYVSVNSIVSGIYMDTLSLKQSIAVCVNDLAKGYQRKFEYPDLQFILKCCELGLKYYPNYAELLLLKAETLKKIYEGGATEDVWNEMNATYGLLAKLDYREIPEEMFLEWIKALENNKERYGNKKIDNTFNYGN